MDLRPGIRFSLKGRRFSHWTPQYLRYRIQAKLRAILRPEDPSLTPRAIAQLDRMLGKDSIGVEWGSGNSTRWFARRAQHLTSIETTPSYYEQVAATLRAEGVGNVDYRLIPHDFEWEDDEQAMHRSSIVRAVDDFADETLDFALIDSAPRGCLCAGVAPKLKHGGLLILDNANWYLPPPPDVRPIAPSSVSAVPGMPGSHIPRHECWPAFARLAADWDVLWSSDGVQMTAIFVKR